MQNLYGFWGQFVKQCYAMLGFWCQFGVWLCRLC